ncbi:hypothetical protein O0881_27095 [Janthinobacterium sp. SUN100]|uniref:hypothetical protein n=1 Tax=Janthinobacterium sp. SUN100 TaxID=3004101 RepID=UPI0025AF8D8E|nr:hypothetical protein [Janthinobacterium sp. SUN100]MDN2705667.1 hypothetical protein [Janthinobacterium sp. SUN100]
MVYLIEAAAERRLLRAIAAQLTTINQPVMCFVRSARSGTLRAGGGVAITAGATWHLTVSRQKQKLAVVA